MHANFNRFADIIVYTCSTKEFTYDLSIEFIYSLYLIIIQIVGRGLLCKKVE